MSTELINKSEILSQSLLHLSYNGGELKMPVGKKLNIYMGIGLWSVKRKLTTGLPVDVMQMLLCATVLRSQIMEANPDSEPKVIILIADSMAIEEGADSERVERIVSLYRKSLDPLLELTKLKEDSQIVLSSELSASKEYQAMRESIEANEKMQALKEDGLHYGYIWKETLNTLILHTLWDVGVKIGWLKRQSNEERIHHTMPQTWDERRFDSIYDTVCPGSPVQYLYSKSGLKQRQGRKNVNVSEACPYTAFPLDQRYTIQLEGEVPLEKICNLQRSVATHWRGTAEICAQLAQVGVLHQNILPKDCIARTNQRTTVYNTLNHWTNSAYKT